MASQAPEHEFVIITQQPLCIEFSEENISVFLDTKSLIQNIYYWKMFGMAGASSRANLDVFLATGGIAPLFMPVPLVLTVYDFVYLQAPETMSFPSRWNRRFNQPWWISRAAFVFAISRAVSDEMKGLYKRSADAVVLPAVDETFYRRSEGEMLAIRKKYQLNDRYNLIVGTLEPRKNLHLFVTQYMAFRQENPDVELPPLILIGGAGWKDTQITSALAEGEREGVVKRLGYVPTEDLPALYSAAEVFFMPSRYEGFGMPILEARRCGCPVVCSDVPAMREAGGNDALFHSPTPEGIRWALEELYLRGNKPVSNTAHEVDWSWDSGATQILSLLRMAAAGNS